MSILTPWNRIDKRLKKKLLSAESQSRNLVPVRLVYRYVMTYDEGLKLTLHLHQVKCGKCFINMPNYKLLVQHMEVDIVTGFVTTYICD